MVVQLAYYRYYSKTEADCLIGKLQNSLTDTFWCVLQLIFLDKQTASSAFHLDTSVSEHRNPWVLWFYATKIILWRLVARMLYSMKKSYRNRKCPYLVYSIVKRRHLNFGKWMNGRINIIRISIHWGHVTHICVDVCGIAYFIYALILD